MCGKNLCTEGNQVAEVQSDSDHTGCCNACVFRSIFSKLAQYDFNGWAVLEWECCLKHPEEGAAEGAPFIKDHIIRVTEKAFDDFAASGKDQKFNKKVLGLI